MNDNKFIEQLNHQRPNSMRVLNGEVIGYDPERLSCTLAYDITTDFCHSVDVVQGGFVTSMLDASMSLAAFGVGEDVRNVSTLEIKVSFLEASRAGRFTAEGRVLRASHRTVFLQAELYDAAGLLTATATSTAKLSRSA